MNELKGKVAIVTGASKGIGAAIARQFAKAGAAVVVNYASSKDDADRVVGGILRDGGKAVAIQADVSKSADVKRLFAETRAAFGSPNILVNNAGVYRFGSLEEATEAEFHRQFDTNVLSTILTTQEAARAFDGPGGSVINLSSISSANPVPNSVIYSASKAAVDTVTDDLVLTDETDVNRYLDLYARLQEAAMSPGDSLDYLATTAEEIRRTIHNG